VKDDLSWGNRVLKLYIAPTTQWFCEWKLGYQSVALSFSVWVYSYIYFFIINTLHVEEDYLFIMLKSGGQGFKIFLGGEHFVWGGVWKLILGGGGSNSPAPPRKSVYAISKHWVLVIVQFLICHCPPVWEYFNMEEYPKLAVTTSVYLWCYSECASTPGKLKIWLRHGGIEPATFWIDSHRGQANFSACPVWMHTQ
jgi:hypothetical protein